MEMAKENDVEEETLRDQIVKAALQLFLEQGYQATSVQEIISLAGTSKGGFCHHFASKDDLLCLIHDTFISYELARGEEVLRRPGSAASRLHQMIIDLGESIDRYRPHVRVFFDERRFLSDEKFAVVKEKRDRYEMMVRSLITEGIRNGEFRSDIEPRIITFALFGMCNWIYQWFQPGKGLTAREIGERFSRLMLRALEPRPADCPIELNPDSLE